MHPEHLPAGFVDDADVEAGDTQILAVSSVPEQNMYEYLATRNGRLVEFLDEAKGMQQAIKLFVLGVHNYCTRNGISARNVVIRDPGTIQTADGAIFRAFIDRRTNLYSARKETW